MALARGLEIVALFLVLNSGTAQIIYQDVDPTFSVQLVKQGNKKELDCYVNTTSPAVDLSWRGPRGSTFQVETLVEHNINKQSTYHRILKIDFFSASDVGEYFCTYVGMRSVPVEYRVTLEQVTEDKLEGEFVNGSKSATLACRPSFTNDALKAFLQGWFKGGIPLYEFKETERFTQIRENFTLHIDKPTREDAGEYIAMYTLSGVSADDYNCTVEYVAAPTILNLPDFKDVKEGQQLELNCEVNGYPVEFSWYKDDEYIEANNTEGIMFSDFKGYKNASLSIKSVVPGDAGMYGCKVFSDMFPGPALFKDTKVRVRGPGDSSSMTKASLALLLLTAVCAWLQI